MVTRRQFGTMAVAGAAAVTGAGAMRWFGKESAAAETAETFEVSYSEAEWRERLTPQQFYVLREHGTERAGTSPLNREKRAGTFNCAGCDLPLFSSETKYESGTMTSCAL